MLAIKLLQRDPSKPSLRERLGAMKGKAAGLGSGVDKGRRAMLASALASTLLLSVFASSEQPGEREAAFLALTPEILPLPRKLVLAVHEDRRLFEAAEAAAGPFPGWQNGKAKCAAWNARLDEERTANGSLAAWRVARGYDLDNALSPLVNSFITQAALDTADSLLAILDRLDSDAEAEDGGDAEPSPPLPRTTTAVRSCGCAGMIQTARPKRRRLCCRS